MATKKKSKKGIVILSIIAILLIFGAIGSCGDKKENVTEDTVTIAESVLFDNSTEKESSKTETTTTTTTKQTTATTTTTTTQPMTTTTRPTTEKTTAPTVAYQTSSSYVLNTNTKRIHYPNCSSVKDIQPENYSETDDYNSAIQEGYKPCGNCHPQ